MCFYFLFLINNNRYNDTEWYNLHVRLRDLEEIKAGAKLRGDRVEDYDLAISDIKQEIMLERRRLKDVKVPKVAYVTFSSINKKERCLKANGSMFGSHSTFMGAALKVCVWVGGW